MATEGTYSRAPFTTYDGIDENGVRAEVSVVTGYGDIFEIEDSENKGKRDVYGQKVVFKVSNTKWKSSGWATSNDPVMQKVNEAAERGEPIHFRIETRRKPEVDRTLPIDELRKTSDSARENINKALVAVKLDEDEDWTISDNAVTRIDEDPTPGGLNSAYNHSPEDLRAAQRGNAPAQQQSNTASKNWANKLEAPPFVTIMDNDGRLNLGSTAVGIPMTMLMFVTEWERKHELEFNDKQRKIIARAMFSAANDIQVTAFDGDMKKPDLSAGSHVRARSILFETIRLYHPITADIVANSDNLKAWRNDIVAKGNELFQWSIEETELFL